MKVAVNTRILIRNRLEGIGWFTYETLKRITCNHPEHQFYFLFDRKPSPEFIFSPNVTPVVLSPQARHPVLWYIWFEHSVTRFVRRAGVDLFLSPDGFMPTGLNIPTIDVIHDLNFLHYKDLLPPFAQRYCQHYFPRFAKSASRIVTVSEFSRNDIAQTLGIPIEKIDVVYNGANPKFTPMPTQEKEVVRAALTKGKPYFVFVGALNPRKNVTRLLKAFDLFCNQNDEGLALVIIGERMFRAGEVFDTYRAMKHKDLVVFTGRLQMEDLTRVVGSAMAMAYVPYFEGFGIPLVEAMYCHVPIIASDRTAIPEVAGGAALYVNPFSVEDIANALSLVALNEQMRNDLAAKGADRKAVFSWDVTANLLYQSIERVMNL